MTEEPRNQLEGMKCFILIPGKMPQEHSIKNILEEWFSLQKVSSVDECDVILVFCPITSRAGTNIDSALKQLNALSESKPAVFMVGHHTFNKEKTVIDSSKYVTRENTFIVDCLFNEDVFLNFERNMGTQERIKEWLNKKLQEVARPPTEEKDELQEVVRPPTEEKDEEFARPPTEEKDEEFFDKLSVSSELTLVLLGKSWSERVAVKNMIFGRDESQDGSSPATQITMDTTIDFGIVDDVTVVLINTPDDLSKEKPQNLKYLVSLYSQKPYALLLIIPAEQSTTEDIKMFDKFQDRLIVIYTVTEEQNTVQIPCEKESNKSCHVLNISQRGNSSQVSELMKKIEEMLAGDLNSSSLTDFQKKAAVIKCEQVLIGEARNYIKTTLENHTLWISPKPSDPYVMEKKCSDSIMTAL